MFLSRSSCYTLSRISTSGHGTSQMQTSAARRRAVANDGTTWPHCQTAFKSVGIGAKSAESGVTFATMASSLRRLWIPEPTSARFDSHTHDLPVKVTHR